MLPVPRSWSEVTPSWMTAALSARLPGVRVSSVEIEPLGSGTNDRARVGLSYTEGSGSGPPSVFVKRGGSLGNRLALVALRALGTEARLAVSGAELPLEHPLPYSGGVDLRRLSAVVVTDDVALVDGRPNDARRPLSVEEVRSGLEGLAHLHAEYWGRLPRALGFLRPWRLGPGWSLVSAASLARGLRRLRGETSCVTPGNTAGELAAQYWRSSVTARSGVQTVLHGDPHPGNTYALPGGRTGFYDWQLARTGRWSHDVGYLLIASLAEDDRRRHERSLLEGYLAVLGECGVGVPEGAWDLYRATPAYGLATWVHTYSFGSFQPRDVCLATISRFSAAYDDLGTARLA